MGWIIKKHSLTVTASNYHINIICIKLNKIVKDHEVGTLLFDPTTENVMMRLIVKTIVKDIWTL